MTSRIKLEENLKLLHDIWFKFETQFFYDTLDRFPFYYFTHGSYAQYAKYWQMDDPVNSDLVRHQEAYTKSHPVARLTYWLFNTDTYKKYRIARYIKKRLDLRNYLISLMSESA